MMTAVNTQDLADSLKNKVHNDHQFDEKEMRQIVGMIDLITTFLNAFPDTPENSRKDIPKDSGYSKYISTLWSNISHNTHLPPSTKRSALYAVQQLQHSLWQK